MCHLICPKHFALFFRANPSFSADYLIQEVAQWFVECFYETVGRSMIHGRLMMLELVFLAELVYE